MTLRNLNNRITIRYHADDEEIGGLKCINFKAISVGDPLLDWKSWFGPENIPATLRAFGVASTEDAEKVADVFQESIDLWQQWADKCLDDVSQIPPVECPTDLCRKAYDAENVFFNDNGALDFPTLLENITGRSGILGASIIEFEWHLEFHD